jgi:chromosome segregation protein
VKFTQLRLAGFKSFVDPTDMRIDPGLTGVIGPNGCGKSNLLEALRWVMGATSAKSLRGDGMEDVIFSGTDARPSRNHAEVVLTVDNTEKLAPARFNDAAELGVSRRITRGAGSAYKINGEEVRAKDVQLLFADAGTGANSPALVRQGQISELIAAKPQNRRRILEEAAGISGLRARRHEAELRLKGAETNLDRLQEFIDETGSRHGALQRQARQASRYRKLSASIRTLEAAVWLNRWRDAATHVEAADAELKDKLVAAEDATRAASEARLQAEILAAKREPARLAEAEASAGLRRLERERDQIEREASETRHRIEGLETRLRELATASGRESEIAGDARDNRDSGLADLEAIDTEIAKEKGVLAGAEAAALDAEERRRSQEAVLDAKSREAAEKRANLDTALRDVTSLEGRLDQIGREISSAETERETLRQSKAVGELTAAEALIVTCDSAFETAKAALEAAEAERLKADSEHQSALETQRQATSDHEALAREAKALERLLASTLVNDANPALNSVRARSGYEHALAAALGDDLDASLDASAPRHWRETECKTDVLPGGCVPLSDHVQGPPALKTRLDAVGVVKPEKAEQAARNLHPGQRLVTLEGDVWRWDGLVARADAPSAAVARLEQKNRLDEIHAELVTTEAGVRTAQAALTAQTEKLEVLRGTERKCRDAVEPAGQASRAAVNDAARLREAAAKNASRIVSLDGILEKLRAESSQAETALKSARAVVATAEGDDRLAAGLDLAREKAEQARLSSADARAALETARRESETRRQRRASMQRHHEAWHERFEAAEKRIAEISGQVTKSNEALDAARARPAELESKLQALTDKLEAAERTASEAREIAASTEDEVKTADSAARSAESAASAAREGRAATEARLSAARERLNETTDRLQDATGDAPGALAKRVEDADIDGLSLSELERRLDEGRQSRERLGAVNLRADQEADELAAKLTEMTTERDDLIAAIEQLRKAVGELSREGRARLLEAFEIVDGHFRNLFATLFEGGHAELRLTDDDDPLEAGLEIFACPPGKKLDTMSLMSGGEQALTACALIFAVFLSNPAPVCVLDEVDAPLDDANVDRYCRMLNEMRRLTETRFLVITHNPLTMSRMDRLYGVTMAERGVSQLVSVDLVGAEQLIAAE